ncbi:MAG: TIGR02466 family protein [Porticoccaceae bacterium]|nr:hypothetical protein [Pseudomonadales bacterium]MCP5171836.1 hypothetical protein [Pseudomonadales bacterium]
MGIGNEKAFTLAAANTELLFAMPIYRCQLTQWQVLNRQLKEVILAKKAVCKGIVRSNQLGWHSKLDLHTWDDASINVLMTLVKSAATQFLTDVSLYSGRLDPAGWQVEAWANVNSSGASNRKHTHDTKSGVILSSFYYVCTGNPVSDEWTGHTWFESRGNIPDYFRFQPELFSRTVDNKPKEGELILFPSWLPHGVREYRGEGERISIAVNLWHRDISLTKSTDQPSPQWAWRCFPGLMNRLKQWRDN